MSSRAHERHSIVPLLQANGLPCLAFTVPWPGTMLGQGSGQTRAHPLQDLIWSTAMTDLWYMKDSSRHQKLPLFPAYLGWLPCADVSAYNPVEPAIKPTVIACSRGLHVGHSTWQLCMLFPVQLYLNDARVSAKHHRLGQSLPCLQKCMCVSKAQADHLKSNACAHHLLRQAWVPLQVTRYSAVLPM